jgi:hypothetical protein
VAVEEPKYSVVTREGAFEVRDYPGVVVAEVRVGGDRRSASISGFRLLAGYIFGGNAGRKSIAMTAPVTQAAPTGTKIAMTAPVSLSGEPGDWTVQFTMPSEYSIDDLPTPNDQRVKIKVVSPKRMAVLKFSGLTGDSVVTQRTTDLEAIVRKRKLTSTGSPSLARYDPPWTPWFMRRNEVMIPVVPTD